MIVRSTIVCVLIVLKVDRLVLVRDALAIANHETRRAPQDALQITVCVNGLGVGVCHNHCEWESL